MNVFSKKLIEVCVTLILILSIFEKIQYSYFTGFDVIAFVFIGLVGISWIRNGFVVGNKYIKVLYFSQISLFALYVLQFIIILLDGRNAIFDQYWKGVVYYGIFNILLVISVIYCFYSILKIDTKTLLKKLLIIGLINIFYNIIQYFIPSIDTTIFIDLLHSDVARFGVDEYGAGVGRLTGLFTDSNNNAAFLLIYISIIFIMIKGTTNLTKKTLLWLLLVVAAVELILTYSRTGWLGLAALLLFVVIKQKIWNSKLIIFLFMIGALVVVYEYKNNFIFNQVMTARLDGLGSENTHMVAAYNVLGIIAQSPIYFIMGTGINCLSVHYETLYGRVGMKAHSLYLQVFCESGIVGLFFTLLFWGTILFLTLKISKKRKDYGYLTILVLVFLIINLTYDSAFQPMFIWVLTPVVLSFKELYGATENRKYDFYEASSIEPRITNI